MGVLSFDINVSRLLTHMFGHSSTVVSFCHIHDLVFLILPFVISVLISTDGRYSSVNKNHLAAYILFKNKHFEPLSVTFYGFLVYQ
jgi:hypothetical protein